MMKLTLTSINGPKIHAIKAIRAVTGLGLVYAKQVADALDAGEPQMVAINAARLDEVYATLASGSVSWDLPTLYTHAVVVLAKPGSVPVVVTETVGAITDGSLIDGRGFLYVTDTDGRPVAINTNHLAAITGIRADEVEATVAALAALEA